MMTKPMQLILNAPVGEAGVAKAQGTKLLTPDGSQVTGIESINVKVEAGGLIKTTVVLNAVLISQGQRDDAKTTDQQAIAKQAAEVVRRDIQNELRLGGQMPPRRN
jgi:hypothetical protein